MRGYAVCKGPYDAASGLYLSKCLAACFFQLGSKTSCSPLHHAAHPEEKRARAHPVVMMDMLTADSSQPQFPLHEGDLWGPSLPAIRGSFRCKHHHHHHGEGQARKSIFPPCSPNSPTQSSFPPSAHPQVTFTLDVRCEAISPVFRIAGWECKRNV